MRLTIYILFLASLATIQFSCKTPAAVSTIQEGADNSMTSVDWDGVYTGTIPCADCQGIETTLQLMPDKTYNLTRKYSGKSDDAISSSGSFTWDATGSIIQLSGEKPGQYKVGENQLFLLDIDGKRISGALANNYILSKDLSGLKEKYWKLVELNGQPVKVSEGMKKEPYLILRAADKRVTAHGGCNNFMGTYEILEGNRIKFSKMAGTLMACEQMDIEAGFTTVLEMADNYNLDGNKLVLNKARMAPLARFEAVYLR